MRRGDRSDAAAWYVPGDGFLQHRGDPFTPGQGFRGSRWGRVKPFCIKNLDPDTGFVDHAQYVVPPVTYKHGGTAKENERYLLDFNEVKTKGAGRVLSSSQTVNAADRTPEETVIGLFWAYDGARGLGVPPRLYNQCVRAIVEQRKTPNTTRENARLFALINAGMADAAIVAWGAKYHYNLWRLVVGIREHDQGFGPSNGTATVGGPRIGDAFWAPLGGPGSNTPGAFNATPDFPAYPSGHATFGAATFEIVREFYKVKDLEFDFVSDELNGKALDPDGSIRTNHKRRMTLTQAITDNALSRVYLGVHWRFDGVGRSGDKVEYGGVPAGEKVAREVFSSCFKVSSPSKVKK